MTDIDVNGTIVSSDDAWIYDYFGIENTSPNRIRKALEEAKGEDVTFRVNSGGGDVFAGNEIYYLIANYKGRTTVDITGFAASAATIICCAGQRVRATPGMQYMIHNVSCSAYGDYNEMDHTSEILQNANRSISNIYRLKTGMSEEDLLELMNNETWMDATRARDLGFVDEIIGDNGLFNSRPLTIHNGVAKILSDEVKNKIRASVKNPELSDMTDEDLLMQRNKLNLLRMRGEIKHV